MDGKSQNIPDEQRQKLNELFPEVFSEGKIDWDKLKATLGQDVDLGERYNLSWKGKSNVFRAIQEQTTKTLKPVPEESVDWDTTQNLFIEGDNLEALKVLHKAYYGKVKMIYIDPPYNTGKDFVYNDKFAQTQAEYESEAGIRDDTGNVKRTDGLRKNSKDGGHFHSNWLNMMYPRLYLARNLLRQDGVIFVSIDDNEVHNLRMIMNEIFGEENFVSQIIWERAYAPVNLKRHFSESHDYILCFARNIALLDKLSLTRSEEADARYKNPDNDPRGLYKADNFSVGPPIQANIYEIVTPGGRQVTPPSGYSWRFSQARYKELLKDNRIWFGENGNNVPAYKRFLTDVKNGLTPMTIWKYKDVGHSQDATKELKELFNGKAYFDYPKPVKLIMRLLDLTTSADDLIVDFFSGSGTTAHAVQELNAQDGACRRWICVQLPEVLGDKTEAYAGGYKNVADIARERIRLADQKIAANNSETISQRTLPLDLGFKVYKLSDSNFKVWNGDVESSEQLGQQMLGSINPIVEGSAEQDLFTELLVKNGTSPLETVEKKEGYYFVPSSNLAICLVQEVTQDLFSNILAAKPEKLIFLDSSLKNNDQLKANLLLQAEQAQIDIEVI